MTGSNIRDAPVSSADAIFLVGLVMIPSLRVFFYRMILNCVPCIWCGGGRVTHLSPDFRRLTVRLALRLRTRNIVGTIYGGSMYSSTDPMYFLMLMKILGPAYVVWDKGCTIRFKRPAKRPLYCHFEITDEMLDTVTRAVRERGETTFTWTVAFRDADGVTHAEFDKVLYLASKEFYRAKVAARAAK